MSDAIDPAADPIPPIDTHGHRAYVGPREQFDIGAAHQFNLMTSLLGLREHHHLLEIGCGSLRAGRLFITWLLPDRYCGLEPNRWLVEAGIEHEIGRDLIARRRPIFREDENFDLRRFGRRFDFILAQSIFSHTAQRQMSACLAAAHDALAPGGRFVASYVEADEDYTGDDWVYPESVPYTRATVRRLAAEAGLSTHPIAWGNQNNQQWVVFHRPDEADGLPVLDEIEALRAENTVLRGHLQSARRPGISPVELARLQEKYAALCDHPAVRAALATAKAGENS